jgi:SAM-dependent methyltransferase
MEDVSPSSVDFYDTLWRGTTRVDQHHKCRARAIESLLKALPPTDSPRRILELGCGTGIISELLARYGEVVGIDQSTVGVASARARVRGTFVVGVLPDIVVTEADFDVCVMSQVVEHFVVEDQVRLLTNARDRVRAGGHLIVTTPNRPVSERMRFAQGELQPIETWLDAGGLRTLLERTGWRVLTTTFAFNFFPILTSRYPWLRGARYLVYDILRLRNTIESMTESYPIGDCTVMLAART